MSVSNTFNQRRAEKEIALLKEDLRELLQGLEICIQECDDGQRLMTAGVQLINASKVLLGMVPSDH